MKNLTNLKLTIKDYYRGFLKNKTSDENSQINKLLDKYFNKEEIKQEVILKLILDLEQDKKKTLVMTNLLKISYGNTIPYSEFAKLCNLPNETRHIATLIGKNILPIIVPCHRIIRKDQTGNYIFGKENKKLLINFEKEQS